MKCTYVIQDNKRKYEEIEFCKGISVLTIVIMHLVRGYITGMPNLLKVAATLGGTGVHVFFFCSGFGLYLSYLRNKVDYITFLKKRFLRVYVPYIIIIIISFSIPLIKVEGNRITALLSHIFLFKMFSPIYDSSFGPFWFMSTLFQFYIVFIPLCIIKNRVGSVCFFFICTLLSVFWWVFTGITSYNSIRPIGCFFLQYLWEFSLAMCIAGYLYEGNKIKLNNILLVIFAFLGVGIEGLLALSGDFLKAFNDFPALVGYGSFELIAYQVEVLKKPGIWLGGISYEWFLIHDMIFCIIFSLIKPVHLSSQIVCGGGEYADKLILGFDI